MVLEHPDLVLVSDSQLSITFETHVMLSKAIHLIPENTLVGHFDVLPGLNEPKRESKTITGTKGEAWWVKGLIFSLMRIMLGIYIFIYIMIHNVISGIDLLSCISNI